MLGSMMFRSILQARRVAAVLTLLAAGLATHAAFAQGGRPAQTGSAQEIGRVQLQGRTVILFGDNTWRFAETSADAASCTGGTIAWSSQIVPLSMCLPAGSRASAAQGAFETMIDGARGEFFGGIIAERVAIDMDAMANIVIENARRGGMTDVQTLSNEVVTLNGHAWRAVRYAGTIQSIQLTYANYTTRLGDQGTVQVILWSTQNLRATLDRIAEEMMRTATVRLP